MTGATAWPDVALPEAVDFLDSQRRPVKVGDRAKMRGNIPYYGASGVVDYVDSYLFDEELILLGEDGENILSRVVPLAFKISGKTWVNNHAHVLRPTGEFDIDFLTAYLESLDYSGLNTGTAQPKLNKQSCSTIRVVKPALAEQHRIAAVLRDTDDLIAALARMIAKKQAIKQGMMQQLLTGKTRLLGFTDPWEVRKLGDLLAYEQPSRYLVSSTDYATTGTPVLTAGKTFLLGYTSDQHDVYNDVPVIIFDDFTTASKYVDFQFKAKSSAMKMLSARPGVNLRYIYERMQLIDFVAVDHKRRWIAEYSKIEIEVPQAVEQRAIAEMLGDADREIAVLRERLTKARAVKAGMMHELFTGRTRLPVEEGAA